MRANELTLYNHNIERALLSALIFVPETLDRLDPIPDAGIFSLPPHRNIYEAILHLQESGKPVEEEFLRALLAKRGQYDELVFVEVLAANPITDIDRYVEELQELERRRRLSTLSIEIRTMVERADDSEEITSRVESRLMELADGEKGEGFVGIGKALDDAQEHIERMESRSTGLTGIDTGFTRLNALTGGFDGGELIVLAARPSMGKTSLALDIIRRTSSMGNGVALLSLEMPRDQIALRMLSAESGVPLQNLRTGRLDPGQKRSLSETRHQMSSRAVYIDDAPNVTLRNIRSRIRRIVSKDRRVRLVAIDYLQLIESDRNKDRHIQVAEISRGLKLLAREMDVAILALSQLNRSLENRADKRPQLSDLRESGSIEQDADLVLFIYRDEVYRREEEKRKEQEMAKKGIDYRSSYKEKEVSNAELIIGKQRNGPLGTVELEFVKKNASFREPSGWENVVTIEYEG